MKNLVDSFNKETKKHTAHCDSFGMLCSCGVRFKTYSGYMAHVEYEIRK